MDLLASTIAVSITAGQGAAVVSLTPDDSFAYVGNMILSAVSVVRIAGAASHKVADVPSGEVGVLWAACGIWSDIEVTPNGRCWSGRWRGLNANSTG